MWSWDSTQITHDQTCWTYDVYNGCEAKGGGGGGVIKHVHEKYRREKDDKDVLDIITMIVKAI